VAGDVFIIFIFIIVIMTLGHVDSMQADPKGRGHSNQ
jgi:hypothetical protein